MIYFEVTITKSEKIQTLLSCTSFNLIEKQYFDNNCNTQNIFQTLMGSNSFNLVENDILIMIVILKIFFRQTLFCCTSFNLVENDILITMVILKIFFRRSCAPIVSIWLENWISRTFIVSRGARLLQKFNLKLPFFQLQMIPKSKCDQRSMLFYLFFIFSTAGALVVVTV